MANNARYGYDAAADARHDAQHPWTSDVTYFDRCQVSAVACMKMVRSDGMVMVTSTYEGDAQLKHALAGVESGKKRGGVPIEIMGLLLGKAEGKSIVVMDCFPLPIEGTETRVIASDESVIAHMVQLSEQIERRRPERFVGWYHSHPFNVEQHSHCFLSATDISTQYSWQSQFGKWTAIVVDPLRSLAKQRPEMAAFRCYPPSYSPVRDQCPDGTIEKDETARQVRWGNSSTRYYQLSLEYFMSERGHTVLDVISRKHLWIRVLSSTTHLESENVEAFSNRVETVERVLQSSRSLGLPSSLPEFAPSSRNDAENAYIGGAVNASAEIAIEQIKFQTSQIVKTLLFNENTSDLSPV